MSHERLCAEAVVDELNKRFFSVRAELVKALARNDLPFDKLGVAELVVYPNPVSQVINVSSQHSKVEEVRIYNVLGEEVLSQKFVNQHSKEVSVDVSGLVSGVYMVEARTEKGVVRKKFVKE